MKLFIATFLIMAFAVLAMALGVIFSNRKIQGSCGGLAALGMEKACDCDRPCERRRRMEEAGRRQAGSKPSFSIARMQSVSDRIPARLPRSSTTGAPLIRRSDSITAASTTSCSGRSVIIDWVM